MKRLIWDSLIQKYRTDDRVVKTLSETKLKGIQRLLKLKQKIETKELANKVSS